MMEKIYLRVSVSNHQPLTLSYYCLIPVRYLTQFMNLGLVINMVNRECSHFLVAGRMVRGMLAGASSQFHAHLFKSSFQSLILLTQNDLTQIPEKNN